MLVIRANFSAVTRMRLAPFAWSLVSRTMAGTVAATCVAAAIIVATDEATSTLGMRAARLAALGPLLACLGALAVCAHARARGELGALEALGMKPWEAAHGAAVAGWACGVLATIALAMPGVDSSSLFPRFLPPIDWAMDASGASAKSSLATIFADGAIRMAQTGGGQGVHGPARWAAMACLAPIALGGPAWAVTPMRARERVGSGVAAAMLLIVVLHLIAAGRVSALWGPLAAVPLCASVIVARRKRR